MATVLAPTLLGKCYCMEASIHSKDNDNFGSSGRTYKVSTSEFEVECAPGGVRLSTVESEWYTPLDSAAVTPIRDIKRTFQLRLSAAELKRIVNAATEANLLRLAAEVQDRPAKMES